MQVAQIMTARTVLAGEIVLHEGQKNNTLYFLRRGRVDIIVSGERIGGLEEAGEIFGEMSVITGQPISATLLAASDVEVFAIDVDRFSNFSPNQRVELDSILYRIYSNVLARRLTNTNNKARQFEIANRELVEAQKRLRALNELIEEAGKKKAAELSQSLEYAFIRIRQVTENHLRPLLHNIAGEAISSDKKAALTAALTGAVNSIDPLLAAFNSERAVKSKHVLLIDPDRKQQTIAKMALGGSGAQLSVSGDAAAAQGLMRNHVFDLIICDLSLAEELKDDFQKFPANNIVFLGSNAVLEYLKPVKSQKFLTNFMTRDPEDRLFTIKSISTTVTKLVTKDLFGIEKYLAWGVDVQEKTLACSDERRSINDSAQEYLRGLGIRSTTLARIDVALEEMMMNAVYDAPTDENGVALFNHLPRTEKIELKNHQVAKVRFACDGMFAAVAVEDPFGALKKETLLDYLESCYEGRPGSLNKGKGGAGRGLHMLIEASDLTIFNVKDGIKTEVISIYNLEAAAQKRDIKSTFHFFFS